MQSMKILFLTRLFYPHIGGVEKHVMEISKVLVAQGHNVTIITERYEKKLAEKEIVKGITVCRINTGKDDKNKKFRIWREMKRLQHFIREADVVHCHDVFFWYLPFRLTYIQKPVYTTFHGYESFPIKKSAILVRKLTEKLSWGNICIGDFISKWYGTKATIVSYGAVDSTNFKMQITKFKTDSAVFIGRLDEQTGVLTYAKAIESVKKNQPKFEFRIIGDGKDRKRLEKNFTVLGFQKDPERYLPKYHFAFVSRYLSILEAFAARRLVFAVYDNPVKEDYLRMAPYAKWIVIEATPEKLSDKIFYFLAHPEEEKKLVENAYNWVKDKNWQSLTALYLKLWKKKKS